MADTETIEKLQILKSMLIARARGRNADNNQYQTLREELLADARLELPAFLRYCIDLNAFWNFIQPQSPTYAGRIQFLEEAFKPTLDALASDKTVREKVYQKGQSYDFYKDIRDITVQAKSDLFVIDAYPDEEVLDLYLEKVWSGAQIRILTNKPQGNFLTVALKFKSKPGVNFEVRSSKDCHDRLFFVDNDCWVMGQSLKDAGKKPTYLVKIESHDLFRGVFEDVWSRAQSLV